MFGSVEDGVADPGSLAGPSVFFVAGVVLFGEGGIGLFSGDVSTGGSFFGVFGGVFVGEAGLVGLGGFGFGGFFLDLGGEGGDAFAAGVVDFALGWDSGACVILCVIEREEGDAD